jgi:hypothetical protein
MSTFYNIIYKWVADNFGQSEADDPSWSIKALADHLSKSDIDPNELNAYTKSNVYGTLDQHYVEEDVENYANDRDIKLTPQQIHNVADRIRNSDWYMSINIEDIEWYIKRELEKGE